MTTETTELATIMEPRDLAQAQAAAQILASSTLVPKMFQGKPNEIIVAIQYGQELGLKPMAALRAVCVINGKPAVYGDGFLAVIQASPLYGGHDETYDEKTATASCTFWRNTPEGRLTFTRTFSKADAEQAKLWGKEGPWQGYPKRMLQMRARGFAGRDAFADTLSGIVLAEEALDYVTVETVEGAPEVQMPTRKSEQPPKALPESAFKGPDPLKEIAKELEKGPGTPAGELFPPAQQAATPEAHVVKDVGVHARGKNSTTYFVLLGNEKKLFTKDMAMYQKAAAAKESGAPQNVMASGDELTLIAAAE